MLIDTHCHIHDVDYPLDPATTIMRAKNSGVDRVICVGTDVENSIRAVNFAEAYDNVFAAVGVHPHAASGGCDMLPAAIDFSSPSLVAVGEIGLDYHYYNSSKSDQAKILELQIDLALRHNLPIIFHVREAFDDFWPIFDNFHDIRGVIHSFTDNQLNAGRALERNLSIGVNGFCTFAKGEMWRELFAGLPLDRILLETDAPYLTPVPFRGKINEPAFVQEVAGFLADIKAISVDSVATQTTINANKLFNLEK